MEKQLIEEIIEDLEKFEPESQEYLDSLLTEHQSKLNITKSCSLKESE